MSDDAFSFTDHCCRHCCGPIVRAGDRYTCAICDASSLASPVGICGCGIKPMKGMSERDGHFRCMLNPARSPANPARVVIGFACEAAQDGPAAPATAKGPHPARTLQGVASIDPLADNTVDAEAA